MPPHTDFAVKDPYTYLQGFGNYHSTEAFVGATPLVNNSPQIPPLGLRTERISGSSFTATRERNMQTWLYRSQSSLIHSEFVPLEVSSGYGPDISAKHLNPNSLTWNSLPVPSSAHWINGQQLLGRNGDPQKKEGIAIWIFSLTESMPQHHAFSSLDGELLIVPQAGALNITTEMGKLMVRQNEICVIPRNVRHRVDLVNGAPCRGYICELFQGHFQLPALGIIGSTGLANVRDFEVPTAYYDGTLINGRAVPNSSNNTPHPSSSSSSTTKEPLEWTITVRLSSRRWSCTQSHTPFDVAAWHGTNYPYKYDLAKFCVLGNLLFDEHDPCLFTVLTAPNYSAAPGTAVVDFAIIPPRYMAAEETLWLPYFHRNTMQEFYAPIVYNQSASYPFSVEAMAKKKDGGSGGKGHEFAPFACGLHGSMSTHGAGEDEFMAMRAADTKTPKKVGTEGVTVFLFETERPVLLTDWAVDNGVRNMAGRKPRAAKM